MRGKTVVLLFYEAVNRTRPRNRCQAAEADTALSQSILKRNMEFVINLTTKSMAFATDWCGVRSRAKIIINLKK